MARGKGGGHPGKRKRKKLRVIPKPDEGTRAVLHLGEDADPGPVIRYENSPPNSFDYVCGACGFVLVEAIPPGQAQNVRNVVLVCPSCGEHNDVGGMPELN